MRFNTLLSLCLLATFFAPTMSFAKGRAVQAQPNSSRVLVPVGESKPAAAGRYEAAPVEDRVLRPMLPDLRVEILAPTQEVGPALAKITNPTRRGVTTPFNVKASIRPVCGDSLAVAISKPLVLELDAGETEFVAIKPKLEYWPDAGCEYRMSVQIDTKNAVTEMNEANNRDVAVFCPMDDGDC